MYKMFLRSLVILLAGMVSFESAQVWAGELYEGKTVQFIVGASPGGGFDTYTRAVARHFGAHLPGKPAVIVENKPGAGGLVAANSIFTMDDPDALTIGILNPGHLVRQSLGDKNIRFDGRKFSWIGAPSKNTTACAIMGFTGMKTLADVLAAKGPIKMGAVRDGTDTADFPKIMNGILGTNFEVITGFQGTAKVRLALQTKEVMGACWGWESMRVTAKSMLHATGDNKLIPFIIHSKEDDPEVRDLPLFTEAIKDEDNRALYEAWSAPNNFMRVLFLSPSAPKDRLAVLRKAFKATLEDPEFVKEAEKSKLDVTYVSGEAVDGYVKKIFSMTPAMKKNLRKWLNIKG
ncbi:MAG TPA: tripartite tricarboxylate transporter substrate-binding protein [Candidatus Binatia bacterium]|nr:tripartite tricarboxylate transporter substrate-binding protein [Candidatus Binatia bacterium]